MGHQRLDRSAGACAQHANTPAACDGDHSLKDDSERIERFVEIIRLLAGIGPHQALIAHVGKQKLFSGMGPHSPPVPADREPPR
jgi:hypothetical protein